MEYIAGYTLMQISQRTQRQNQILDESRVIGWMLQILDALHYLHSRPAPVIHRDIKPENLILTPEGRIVLVDFGLLSKLNVKLRLPNPSSIHLVPRNTPLPSSLTSRVGGQTPTVIYTAWGQPPIIYSPGDCHPLQRIG